MTDEKIKNSAKLFLIGLTLLIIGVLWFSFGTLAFIDPLFFIAPGILLVVVGCILGRYE